tara:strand:- start:809 stop:1072 length:264 start_codon:yes stop_codon:yes gene_type:complete
MIFTKAYKQSEIEKETSTELAAGPYASARQKVNRKKETHVEVATETASCVIRRRHGSAMPSPHALPEAPSAALLRALFPCGSLIRFI